jgi:hypothetical protein
MFVSEMTVLLLKINHREIKRESGEGLTNSGAVPATVIHFLLLAI